MIKRPIEEFKQQEVLAFIQKSAFLKALQAENDEQLQALLKVSEVELYEPGETLQDKGANAEKFFILLQGRLEVHVDTQDEPVGHVLAGQLVGALAVINHKPRIASLQASRSTAILLAIDFSAFGALKDVSRIQIETKICLYRSVVTVTFWKLDEYRYRHDDEFLTEGLSRYSEYTGVKNGLEELTHLAGAVSYLGGLLEQWNRSR